MKVDRFAVGLIAAAAFASLATTAPGALAAAWEPARPVELVVPAGTGGGADQMARLLHEIVRKHNLMQQPLSVVNKPAGAGAEGFLAMKDARRDRHKLVITLSNLFTTPLATGVPFNWADFTPIAMLALDQFVLWINADAPYTSARSYLGAVRRAGPDRFKMGGTGARQEDQIITIALEKATGTRFAYVPFKSGGEVAAQLVGRHIDSSVNNPIEAVAQWRAGKLRPLCVFDTERIPYTHKIAGNLSWNDIPTCKEAGVPVDYLMLRGVFGAPGIGKDAVDFYLNLFRRVRETEEWKKFMVEGAFNPTFLSGPEYVQWIEKAETAHRDLMWDAGFVAR